MIHFYKSIFHHIVCMMNWKKNMLSVMVLLSWLVMVESSCLLRLKRMQDERIYTDAINQNVNFRAHVYKAEGCSWTLYEDPRAQSGRSQVVSPKPDWGRVILPEVGSIWRVDRSVPRRNLVEDDAGFGKKIAPNPPNIQRILDMFDITSLDQIE